MNLRRTSLDRCAEVIEATACRYAPVVLDSVRLNNIMAGTVTMLMQLEVAAASGALPDSAMRDVREAAASMFRSAGVPLSELPAILRAVNADVASARD